MAPDIAGDPDAAPAPATPRGGHGPTERRQGPPDPVAGRAGRVRHPAAGRTRPLSRGAAGWVRLASRPAPGWPRLASRPAAGWPRLASRPAAGRARRTGRRLAGRGVAAGLAALLLVAGCADDGRALAEPGPDQTTTTDPTGVGAGGTADSAGTTAAVTLSSPSVGDGQEMPAEFTCTGGNISPALTWSNIPMGAAELAIVLRNLDDGGFLHWIVANLPAQSGGVAEGTLPAEAVQALNETGTTGYAGPCPEGATQHYEFTLYALAQPIGLAPETPARQALEQIESASQVASAVLSVTATP